MTEKDPPPVTCDRLSALREDRGWTQQDLAELLGIRQSAISKLERQDDVRVRTLERYLRALGGELELRVRFPDGGVLLTQFVDGGRG